MERTVLTFEDDLSAAEALAAISDTNPANVLVRRQMMYPIVGDGDRPRASSPALSSKPRCMTGVGRCQ